KIPPNQVIRCIDKQILRLGKKVFIQISRPEEEQKEDTNTSGRTIAPPPVEKSAFSVPKNLKPPKQPAEEEVMPSIQEVEHQKTEVDDSLFGLFAKEGSVKKRRGSISGVGSAPKKRPTSAALQAALQEQIATLQAELDRIRRLGAEEVEK